MTIYPPETEASFKVMALKEGVITVKYQLVGINALQFNTPKNSTVYAYKKTQPSKPVDISIDFYRQACKEKWLNQCSGQLKMLSSCKWDKGSNGLVSIKSRTVELPLSLFGVTENEMDDLKDKDIPIYTIGVTKKYLENRELPTSCLNKDQCPKFQMNVDKINYVITNNIFQRAYYNEVNNMLPSWLRMKVDTSEGFFAAENFQSLLGKGSAVKNIKYCSQLLFDDHSQYSVYIPKTSTNLYFLSSRKALLKSDNPLCVAVNLCTNDTSLSIPGNQKLTFDSELESIGITNFKLSLTGFGYGKTYIKCAFEGKVKKCFDFNSYWRLSSNVVLNSNLDILNFHGTAFASVSEKVRISVVKNTFMAE